MRRRLPLLLLALLLPAAVAAQDADAPLRDPDRIAERLDRLQERLVQPGALLPRYERSLRQLEETLQKGEYRRFHEWLRQEVVEPWRQVEVEPILLLAHNPPGNLSASQRMMLRRNELKVRALNNRLRRARRLLTRVGQMNDERQRRLGELRQLRRRYLRHVLELEQVAPERAPAYRDWLDAVLAPRLERLAGRDRFVSEAAGRLQRWTEDPALRQLLERVRQVTTALQRLRRHYSQF